MDVNIFINASHSAVKDYVLTQMIFIGVLPSKSSRRQSEKNVAKMIDFIKSKNWDWKKLPDKALKHIEKYNLEIQEPLYYKRLIKSWKK